ncbi:MAG: PAS domain S-box protein [Candidatus Nitrotoga sp.]|nr:PAS domain S-box protein [Candidatus Nitrotoga sp.]
MVEIISSDISPLHAALPLKIMLKNLTIKSRLILFLCFMAVILLGIESVALFGMSRAKDSLKTVYENRILALDQLTGIESLILQNRLAIAASLVTPTPDEISINTAKIEKNITEIEMIWQAYVATLLIPEEKTLAAKFADDRNKLVTRGLNPAVAALRANEIEKANRIVVETIRPLYQPVGEGIKKLGKLQLTVTKQEYEDVQSRYETIRNIIIATAIIGLGLALWLSFLLVRAISRPLEDVVRIAKGVAAGNLTQQIEVRSKNEVGQLMQALKEIHDNLVKVIDQVRDSEQYVRTVLDNVDKGIIVFNASGVIEIFNPAAEQTFGYRGHEIIGKNASLLTQGPSQCQRDSSFEPHLELNKLTVPGVSREVVGVHKNGTHFPLGYKASEVFINTKRLVIAVTRDLTARKKSENTLLRAKEYAEQMSAELASYIHAIDQHAIVSVADTSGRITHVNDKFCEISGYSRDEILGHDHRIVNSGTHPSAFFTEMWASITRGYIWRDEICNRAKSGELYWVDSAIVPVKDVDGKIERYISVRVDITKRKQGEHELIRLGRVLDESLNEIYVFDTQTLHFTMVSAKAQRNLDYSMDELREMTELNLEPNLTHEIFEQRISPLRRGEKDVVTYEVEHQRKDKSLYPIEICIHLSANEFPPVFVAIIQDITERKNIERMKSELISTVSHELRTPLTSIRGSLGLIVGGVAGELSPQAKMLVDIAHKNSERLILLVNDILDMEKIEAGKMELQFKPVELMPLLHQALEANCAYGEQFNVSYKLENDLPGIMVNVDANRLMQVRTNLLSNAAKFSSTGNNVTVAVIVSGNRVRVEVKDHGSGISEQFRSQIFQKFAQGDSSDTRKKGGTGLGLSITRAIVEKMGGYIGFSSEPNVLTTFFIEFPIWEETVVTTFGKNEGKGKRVLICEDDHDIAALLRLMLEQDGQVADIAYDTEQAKKMLAQRNYAAMTLDLALPDQNGIAFIRELRMEKKTASLPIVVVSARAIEGSLELNGEVYCVIDWISKPINQEHMVLAVRRAVGQISDIRPRVLHVEDDHDIFQVMHGIVGDMADLDHAGMLTEARQLLKRCRYDLVILDLTLPDGSGQELLPLLNGATPPIPVMVFSAREMEREEIQDVASVLVKSRTSDAQLLATIKRLIEVE